MAVAFGVSSTGFLAKSQQQILSEEVADALALIKNDLDLSPVSPPGQILAIEAEKDAEVWELAQTAYNATNRGAAEGALLDNIGALTGCLRNPATYSAVWCMVAIKTAGTYAKGTLVGFIAGLSSQTASNLFDITAPATVNGSPISASNPYVTSALFQAPLTGSNFANALIGANAGNPLNIGAFTGQIAVPGWMPPTVYDASTVVTNGSANITFSAPKTLPQGTPFTFDASGNVYYLASGITASASATLSRPFVGTGGTVAATILGLADLSSPAVGADVEQDTPYRVRQFQELGAQGSCNLDAIRVAVIRALQAAPSPVVAIVSVYENTTNVTDSDGVPPHDYQVVVFDGVNPNTVQDDPIIGLAIWNNKPAGNEPFGSTGVVITDSQGVQRTMHFTRPTQLPVYMVVNVAISSTASATAVAAAISKAFFDASQGKPFSAYGQTVAPLPNAPTTLAPGVDIIPSAFRGLAQAQDGVVSVTNVFVATSPPATTDAILHVGRNFVGVLTGLVVNCTIFVP